jgi:hypothetical protein
VRASYGGQEAPDSDTQSLSTGDPDNQTPLNPFRFSAKRMDSGTADGTGSVARGRLSKDFGTVVTAYGEIDRELGAVQLRVRAGPAFLRAQGAGPQRLSGRVRPRAAGLPEALDRPDKLAVLALPTAAALVAVVAAAGVAGIA